MPPEAERVQKMPPAAKGIESLWNPQNYSAHVSLEQINFEKVYLLCKDLPANPCHEMLVGELGSPLSKHFKVKMLYI